MQSMEFAAGASLGPYCITAHLATTPLAEVYRAHQASLDREVTLKVLSPQVTAKPGFLDRFRREARAAAQLHHPNIVPVLDFGAEGDLCYLVTAYVPGPTLEERLEGARASGERLGLSEAARIARDAGAALDYAHRRGVVHGNVSPAEIVLAADGEVALGGFGLSSLAEGMGLGDWLQAPLSPAYLSPEQGRGQPAGPAGDLYSLGAILYEALTGRPPFVAASPLDVVVKHLSEPPAAPRSLAPDLPPAVEQALLKALAKDPAGRWGSGAELVGALTAPVPGEGAEPAVPAAPPMPETGLSATVANLLAALLGKREGAEGGGRGWWAQALALLGAGLAVAQYVVQVFDLINRPLAPVVRALPYAIILFLAVAAVAAALILVRPAPPAEKRIAGAALGVIAVASVTWGGWTCYNATRPPKAVIILVAEFQGDKATKGVDWGKRIYLRVRDEVVRLGLESRVEVRRTFQGYDSSEQARATGEAQKATLVLWGWYDDLGVSPHFEILRSARRYASALAAPPVDLVDFDLYARAGPQEMVYISAVVLGLARYAESDFQGAVQLFSAAIAAAPAVSTLQGQEVAYFYRGVAGLDAHQPMEAIVADLQEAARRKPDMYQAHWGLAIAYTAYCTPTLTLDAALAEAETVTRLRPADSMAYWLLGQIHAERQEWEQAAAAARKAVELDPANGDAYTGLARALEELGRNDEARAARQQALEARQKAAADQPKDPAVAQDDLGTALFFLEQYGPAIAAYREALRLAPGNSDYHRHLAGAYHQQSKSAAVGASDVLTQAIAEYQAAVHLDPYDALAFTQLADIYLELGRHEEALKAYEGAVQAAPCDADAVFLLASQYDQLGRQAEAEATFRRLAELKPSSSMAWQYLGMAAMQRGDLAAAEAGYRAAVQAAPGEAGLHYGLAGALYGLGRYAEAEAEYRRTVELAPQDALSFSSWGDALGKLGRASEAIAAYRKALELDPRQALTWVSLGLQYELGKDWPGAEQAYAEAARLSPGDAMVHSAHGRALWQLRRLPEAAQEYEAAARLAPNEAGYQESLALAYAGLGQPDKAVAAAEATLRLNPASALAHLILAGVAEDRGDRERARAKYGLVLQYAGGNAALQQAAQQGLARVRAD